MSADDNNSTSASVKRITRDTLWICLDNGLRLLHPFMPFVTEELWQRLPQRLGDTSRKESFMISDYPTVVEEWTDDEIESQMVLIESSVRSIRSLRMAYLLLPKQRPEASLLCKTDEVAIVVEKGATEICTLASLASLKNVLGKTSSTVYAVALLAAGQSSSITGTYAGQYIMQGFLNMKMKVWLRNFLSRSIAIIPSLIVSVIYGSSGAGKLIIISSIILSFQLPYTLIPLLKFTSSDIKMGPHKNSKLGTCILFQGVEFLGWRRSKGRVSGPQGQSSGAGGVVGEEFPGQRKRSGGAFTQVIVNLTMLFNFLIPSFCLHHRASKHKMPT